MRYSQPLGKRDLRDASRAAKERCDEGFGVGTSKQAVYLDFAAAIERYGKIEVGKHGNDQATQDEIIALGKQVVKEKYGNLFEIMIDENILILHKLVLFVLNHVDEK